MAQLLPVLLGVGVEALAVARGHATARQYGLVRATLYRHLPHMPPPPSEAERRRRLLAARSDGEILEQLQRDGRMSLDEAEKLLARLRPQSAPVCTRSLGAQDERAQLAALDKANQRAADDYRVRRSTGGARDGRRFLRSWEEPEGPELSQRDRELARFLDEQRDLRRAARR